MTSKELDEQIIQMQNDVWRDIEHLSDLRERFNCFDEKEEPYYRALSNAIEELRKKAYRIGRSYRGG